MSFGEPRHIPLLQQLRKTRRNDLEEQFPKHFVNKGIGHTREVANGNYLEVLLEHWQKAT